MGRGTIDRATGAATQVATLDGADGDSIAALAFNQAGVLYGARIAFSAALSDKALLVTIDPATGHVTTVGQTVNKLDAIAFDPNGTPPPNDMALFASALPLMRSVEFQQSTATFFVTMIVTGTGVATGCRISPSTPIAANFLFQTTDAGNNLVGFPDIPENIAGGAAQTFLLAFEPTASFPATEVQLEFVCNGAGPAGVISGVNTVIVSSTGGPDIVALALTLSNDGIVNILGANGAGAFAVATVNLGTGGNITASANTGGLLSAAFGTQAVLPISIGLCRTDAQGQCATQIQSSVTQQIDPNETPTFAVFVTGQGVVPFDPANNRIFVLFSEGTTLRGATSVAVRTTTP